MLLTMPIALLIKLFDATCQVLQAVMLWAIYMRLSILGWRTSLSSYVLQISCLTRTMTLASEAVAL